MTESLRTISQSSPVDVRRMFGGRPVLQADPSHPWEARVVLNPAATLVETSSELDALAISWDLTDEQARRLSSAGGACVMLYRAQGAADPAKHFAASSLGLAVLTPQLELVKRWPEPVIQPDEPFHNLGVEDARCTRVGDRYYLYYTGYGADDPLGPQEERRVRICLATTRNFLHWELHGPVAGELDQYPNKNAALFPEPVDGRWLLLHRPMAGPDAMTIHLAEASDPAGPWDSRGPLMPSYRYREFERSWIGAGGPPVSLGDGRFLMIYHQGHFDFDGAREYDLAAALLDFRQDQPLRARIEPLMRPETDLERRGEDGLGVDNVLFTCANYPWNDDLVIPYAGADSRIFGAAVSTASLIRALEHAAIPQ